MMLSGRLLLLVPISRQVQCLLQPHGASYNRANDETYPAKVVASASKQGEPQNAPPTGRADFGIILGSSNSMVFGS